MGTVRTRDLTKSRPCRVASDPATNFHIFLRQLISIRFLFSGRNFFCVSLTLLACVSREIFENVDSRERRWRVTRYIDAQYTKENEPAFVESSLRKTATRS